MDREKRRKIAEKIIKKRLEQLKKLDKFVDATSKTRYELMKIQPHRLAKKHL